MGKHRTSVRKKVNKVIPMPLDANFFFERALFHLNRNDLQKALKYFWRVIDIEPKNPVHYCNLAGLLSEMGRFKESNDMLLYVVDKLDSSLTECYYYIANNYAYLEDLEMSFKYTHRYLDVDPNGEYVEEANEMLSYLSAEINDFSLEIDGEDKELLIQHYKAKALLEEGKYYEAIRKFKAMVQENPDFLAARNNLALAYFYIGNYIKAIEQAKLVFEKESTNVHALCNLAIFYHHLNEEQDYQTILGILKKIYPIKKEQYYKLATTFALLGEHQLAYKHLSKIIYTGSMLNSTILHYGAVAAFNTENYDTAQIWWEKISKMDRLSNLAPFYLELINNVNENENQIVLPNFCYQYEMPYVPLINEIQLSPQKFDNMFTLNLFNYGLNSGEDSIKEQIILGLARIKGENAEQILRDFLLNEEESYYLKNKVLLALEEMNANPPYHMKMNKKLYEMDRQTPDFSLWKNNWIEVLDLVERKMAEQYDVIELYDAKTLWFEFISQTYPKTPQIRKIEGWVAALEYMVAKMHQKTVSISKLAEKYQVSNQTISRNIIHFEEVLKVNKKIKNTYNF